jgi:hypothetical protein
MKRLCIWLTLILVLFMFISTSATVRATHKSAGYGSGKWSVGGYVGYGFGFGDAFKEYKYGIYAGDLGWVGVSW